MKDIRLTGKKRSAVTINVQPVLKGMMPRSHILPVCGGKLAAQVKSRYLSRGVGGWSLLSLIFLTQQLADSRQKTPVNMVALNADIRVLINLYAETAARQMGTSDEVQFYGRPSVLTDYRRRREIGRVAAAAPELSSENMTVKGVNNNNASQSSYKFQNFQRINENTTDTIMQQTAKRQISASNVSLPAELQTALRQVLSLSLTHQKLLRQTLLQQFLSQQTTPLPAAQQSMPKQQHLSQATLLLQLFSQQAMPQQSATWQTLFEQILLQQAKLQRQVTLQAIVPLMHSRQMVLRRLHLQQMINEPILQQEIVPLTITLQTVSQKLLSQQTMPHQLLQSIQSMQQFFLQHQLWRIPILKHMPLYSFYKDIYQNKFKFLPLGISPDLALLFKSSTKAHSQALNRDFSTDIVLPITFLTGKHGKQNSRSKEKDVRLRPDINKEVENLTAISINAAKKTTSISLSDANISNSSSLGLDWNYYNLPYNEKEPANSRISGIPRILQYNRLKIRFLQNAEHARLIFKTIHDNYKQAGLTGVPAWRPVLHKEFSGDAFPDKIRLVWNRYLKNSPLFSAETYNKNDYLESPEYFSSKTPSVFGYKGIDVSALGYLQYAQSSLPYLQLMQPGLPRAQYAQSRLPYLQLTQPGLLRSQYAQSSLPYSQLQQSDLPHKKESKQSTIRQQLFQPTSLRTRRYLYEQDIYSHLLNSNMSGWAAKNYLLPQIPLIKSHTAMRITKNGVQSPAGMVYLQSYDELRDKIGMPSAKTNDARTDISTADNLLWNIKVAVANEQSNKFSNPAIIKTPVIKPLLPLVRNEDFHMPGRKNDAELFSENIAGYLYKIKQSKTVSALKTALINPLRTSTLSYASKILKRTIDLKVSNRSSQDFPALSIDKEGKETLRFQGYKASAIQSEFPFYINTVDKTAFGVTDKPETHLLHGKSAQLRRFSEQDSHNIRTVSKRPAGAIKPFDLKLQTSAKTEKSDYDDSQFTYKSAETGRLPVELLQHLIFGKHIYDFCKTGSYLGVRQLTLAPNGVNHSTGLDFKTVIQRNDANPDIFSMSTQDRQKDYPIHYSRKRSNIGAVYKNSKLISDGVPQKRILKRYEENKSGIGTVKDGGITISNGASIRQGLAPAEMVVLAPAAVQDKGVGYMRTMPAQNVQINHLEPTHVKQQEKTKSPIAKPVSDTFSRQIKMEQHSQSAVDALKPEEINRLAEKVYAQLEIMLEREKRRFGF